MEDNKSTVSIAIDMKKDRIRIHKTTLIQLGQPKYLQLLVNPDLKIVAIRGSEIRSNEKHIVKYSLIKSDASFELYSKLLVEKLMLLFPNMEKECTYRLTGEIHTDKKTAFFPLDTMQRVEGGI